MHGFASITGGGTACEGSLFHLSGGRSPALEHSTSQLIDIKGIQLVVVTGRMFQNVSYVSHASKHAERVHLTTSSPYNEFTLQRVHLT